ncbi:hypothetical protein D5085_18305 [Ectothiorhodospiraceae bacterium BW-2]|nr:hypothetical protein D5085_18305 [Ectothiorhodospiraceae bacterium BW-2]
MNDIFSTSGNLSALSEGASLSLNSTPIGTVTTHSGGTLQITFAAGVTKPQVDETLQSLAYSYSGSLADSADYQLQWRFSDGNSGAQGSGGPLVAKGGSGTSTLLFVSDYMGADSNIVTVLQGDGHSVTVVDGNYDVTTTTTPYLLSDLSGYDAVYWSASGDGSGNMHSDAGLFTHLSNYVSAGGKLFITGYDSIASPTDTLLIQFIDGLSTSSGDGSALGAITGINSLSTGLFDLQGLTPTGGYGDQDYVVTSGATPVLTTGSANSSWTIRTLGSGEIAYVGNGASSSGVDPSWAVDAAVGDGSGAYNGAVRNFAYNAVGGIAVTVAVNAAPTFSGGAMLAAVAEDSLAPAGASVGDLFAALFNDADGDSLAGVAIVSDAANLINEGSWQYSTDSGITWHAVSGVAVSTGAALLLDSVALLRFVPVADYHGTPGSLMVHAVDNSAPTLFSSGAVRQTFDTTIDGVASVVSVSGTALTTSVTMVNDAPLITSSAVTSVNEDSPYSYTLAATDIDSDPLTYSAVTLPSWLSFDAASGVLSGLPMQEHVGSHAVTLRVSDGTVDVDQSFTIDVANVNDSTQIWFSGLTLGPSSDNVDTDLMWSRSEPDSEMSREIVFRTTSGGGLFSVQEGTHRTAPGAHDRHLVVKEDGNLYSRVWGGTSGVEELTTNGLTLTDGNLHRVLFTMGSRGTEIYVDGQLVLMGTLTSSGAYNDDTQRLGASVDGNQDGFGGTFFSGELYSYRAWDSQLSQSQALGDATLLPSAVYQINLNQVSDPTQITALVGSNYQLTPVVEFIENGAAVTVAPTLRLTDTDSAPMVASATISIVAGGLSGDELSVTLGATAIHASYDSATRVLTLTGSDTLANYQTVLQSLQFANVFADTVSTLGNSRTIRYQLTDSEGGVVTADRTINMVAVNDAPVAHDASNTIYETSSNSGITTVNGSVTYSDIEGDSSSITAVRVGSSENSGTAGTVGAPLAGSYGNLTLNSDGSYSYVIDNATAAINALNSGQTLTDYFNYTFTDNGSPLAASDSAVLTVTIVGTNDAAVIGGTLSGSVTEDTSFLTNGTATATDADNPDNSFQAITNYSSYYGYGTYSVESGGSWSYTLNNSHRMVDALGSGQTLSDHFTLYSVDGTAQTVTITINGYNDIGSNSAPVATADSYTVPENYVGSLASVLGNDSDSNSGDIISVTRVGNSYGAEVLPGTGIGGNWGILTLYSDGTVDYSINYDSLASGQTVTDSFNYTVSDRNGALDIGQITITITGENDTPLFSGALATAATVNSYYSSSIHFYDIDSNSSVTPSISSGSIPPGLSASLPTGGSSGYVTLSGTPTTSGSYPFGLTVTDGSSSSTYNTTIYVYVSPVTIDLNQDGLDYIALSASTTTFDYNGDGYGELTAWMGSTDGLLVLDLGSDSQITDRSEFVFTDHAPDAKTDMEALQTVFDSNQDGWLDNQDSQWSEFAIWQDGNSNGISEAGEVKSLAEWGIARIGLVSDGELAHPVEGVTVHGQSVVQLADGSTTTAADAAFAYRTCPLSATEADEFVAQMRQAQQQTLQQAEQNRAFELSDSDFEQQFLEAMAKIQTERPAPEPIVGEQELFELAPGERLLSDGMITTDEALCQLMLERLSHGAGEGGRADAPFDIASADLLPFVQLIENEGEEAMVLNY